MWQVEAVNRSKNVARIGVAYYCGYSIIDYEILGVRNKE
jgi:hypothetical protein